MIEKCQFEAQVIIQSKKGGWIVTSGIPLRDEIFTSFTDVVNAISLRFNLISIGEKIELKPE